MRTLLMLMLIGTGTPVVFARGKGPQHLLSEELIRLWQAGDAEGLANLWSGDGEWMNLVGSRRLITGRKAIQQVWEQGLKGRSTPESLAIQVTITAVRSLSPGLAQVDAVIYYGLPETGVIREAITAVMELRHSRWYILSARVARIANPDQP